MRSLLPVLVDLPGGSQIGPRLVRTRILIADVQEVAPAVGQYSTQRLAHSLSLAMPESHTGEVVTLEDEGRLHSIRMR